MDPRFLRTFVTVVRLASFSAAARELGYTQSAVSQHIAALEGDLGTVLLVRRPVEPTAAGERLLDDARPTLAPPQAARAGPPPPAPRPRRDPAARAGRGGPAGAGRFADVGDGAAGGGARAGAPRAPAAGRD